MADNHQTVDKYIKNEVEKKNVNSLDIQDRRFDSIAWLLQADFDCGACTFDFNKKQLLIAVNSNPNKSDNQIRNVKLTHINNIRLFLSEIAFQSSLVSEKILKKRQELSENENFDFDSYNIYRDQQIEKLNKYCKDRKRHVLTFAELNFNMLSHDRYRKAFSRALRKLTNSIVSTFLYPKSNEGLNKDICESIKNIHNIKIIEPEKSDNIFFDKFPHYSAHAEMLILDKLYERGYFKSDSNIDFYIGISKKCCLHCEITIQAVNKWLNKTKISSVPNDENTLLEKEIITYRGEHNYIFTGIPPKILFENDDLKNDFLDLLKPRIIEFLNNGEIILFKGKAIDRKNIEELFKKKDIKLVYSIRHEKAGNQLQVDSSSSAGSSIPNYISPSVTTESSPASILDQFREAPEKNLADHHKTNSKTSTIPLLVEPSSHVSNSRQPLNVTLPKIYYPPLNNYSSNKKEFNFSLAEPIEDYNKSNINQAKSAAPKPG